MTSVEHLEKLELKWSQNCGIKRFDYIIIISVFFITTTSWMFSYKENNFTIVIQFDSAGSARYKTEKQLILSWRDSIKSLDRTHQRLLPASRLMNNYSALVLKQIIISQKIDSKSPRCSSLITAKFPLDNRIENNFVWANVSANVLG